MAYYLVRAHLKQDLLGELREHLEKQEFLHMRPFGDSLTRALSAMRSDPDTGEAVWEEEDYCSPPLTMERCAVLDRYFDDIRIKQVSEGEGWTSIAELPPLWGEGS